MLTLKKVAVTGGLASGKTSVCNILKNYGAYVVNADEIVHQILTSDLTLYNTLLRELGPDIVTNGNLDRSKIAKKVFSNPEKLRLLEALIHPMVLEKINKTYEQIKSNKAYSLFVAEIPLLFEIHAEKYFDFSVAVIADLNHCRNRFTEATKYPPEEYESRMERQLSQKEKAKKADFVIVNDGTAVELEKKVINLLRSPKFNGSR